jgi:hypothetical protein
MKKETFRKFVSKQLNEKTDHSELPDGDLSKIKSNISKGAKDTNQLWANALELVHQAYEIAQIQRPDITMEGAWKQYEEMIKYAVQELAKARGMDGDWRMTSLSEGKQADVEEIDFSIETTVDGLPVNVIRKAKSIDEIIKPFYSHNVTGHDIELRHRGPNNVCLYFCKDGKRTGDKVQIRKR